MNLYKYIDSQNPYWAFPLRERRLHFSTAEELRTVNDQEELNHTWHHRSNFFTRFGHHFSDSYNRLFSNSRILCLGKNLNRTCWNTFIQSGQGVCYEFEFRPNGNDVTSNHIEYNDSKELNVPSYILRELGNSSICGLLGQTGEIQNHELRSILSWMGSSRELHEIFERHILHEMTLKKKTAYRREREYRFIHIVDPVGPVQPRVRLVNSKATFEELGLRLLRVHTKDIDWLQREIGATEIPFFIPRFLR